VTPVLPQPPAVAWPHRLATLAAVEAMAVAAWLLSASIHIVQWPAAGPIRLALTRPAWHLAALVACASLAGSALAWSPRHERLRRSTQPFLLLWVLVVPYLPWLPDRLPLLLVLAGPARWLVVGIAVLQAVRHLDVVRVALRRLLSLERRAVFGLSLVAYLGVGLYTAAVTPVGGDEPHYLVIIESLLRDGDLQIENNHARGDYRSFFGGDLRPDYMQRGQNGQIYSIHAPGLPALLLPAYVVGGRLGAIAFLCFLAALTALAMFDLADRLAGRQAAVLTWAATCLTVPFVPHAWSIFPEMPGALLVAWGALWLWREADEAGPATWAVRGTALALLPWLHTKFIVLLAMLSVGFGLRLIRRPTRLLAVATPIAVSTALWFLSFYLIYGTWNPEAPYGAYTRANVLTRNIPHGLVGLLFDQKFGLLVYSPACLFAAAGAWTAMRRPAWRLPSVVLLAATALFVGSTARLYMFWGGSSAPARFLVPVLPCLAPFLALAIDRSRSTASRALLGICLVVGLGAAAVGVARPTQMMLYSEPHGYARLLEWLQGGAPLALLAPVFTEPTWPTQLAPLALWLGAATLAVAAAFTVSRRTAWSSWRVAGGAMTMGVVAIALFTARPAAAVRDATARRGASDVLWRFDGDRHRALDYERLRRPTTERLQALTTVTLRRAVAADGPLELGPVQLPPGEFEAEVWFASSRPRTGEITVEEPRAVLGRVNGPLENPTRVRVSAPAPTRRTMVRVVDPQIAAAVSEARLVPRAVVPPPARDPRPSRAVESVRGRPGAYLVYTDEEAYPEMGTFWTRGTASTTVLVAPGDASQLLLTISTGPEAGTVDLAVGTEVRTVQTQADVEQVVAFPLPPGQRLVPMTIRSNVMFRPSDVDPRATDRRGLGCRVQVTLE
jgi:hypothetical protein